MMPNLTLKKILSVFLIASTLLLPLPSRADSPHPPENNQSSTTLMVASTIALCSAIAYGLHKLYTWHKNYVRRNELQKTMPVREYDATLDSGNLKQLLTRSYKEEELSPQEISKAIGDVEAEIAKKDNVTYVSYTIINGSNTLCAFLIARKTGWIELLVVDPLHYRNGYGEALLRNALRKLRDLFKCTEIYLGALGARAEYLYEKVGFARTKEYYRKIMPVYHLSHAALEAI